MEERFADTERQLLIVLLAREMVRISDDPEMGHHVEELDTMIRRLSGTDTVLIAQRAYPSRRDRATA